MKASEAKRIAEQSSPANEILPKIYGEIKQAAEQGHSATTWHLEGRLARKSLAEEIKQALIAQGYRVVLEDNSARNETLFSLKICW